MVCSAESPAVFRIRLALIPSYVLIMSVVVDVFFDANITRDTFIRDCNDMKKKSDDNTSSGSALSRSGSGGGATYSFNLCIT